MIPEIRKAFVTYLRASAAGGAMPCRGAEMRLVGNEPQCDAYGELATFFTEACNDDLDDPWRPLRHQDAPNEYFFVPRNALLAWSGLTPSELTQLITWNDEEKLNFFDMAARIEREWK